MALTESLTRFLASVHPYDSLLDGDLATLAEDCIAAEYAKGHRLFDLGDTVDTLYIIVSGEVEILDETGVQLSLLGPRNSFGERAILRDAAASRTALIGQAATLILLPGATLLTLIDRHPKVARFFDRRRPTRAERKDLTTLPVAQLMTRDPMQCTPDTSIQAAAAQMHASGISSLCVSDGQGFRGIVTVRDMTGRVVAKGRDPQAPVSTIMTEDVLTLPPSALGTDVLHVMMEKGIGHIPILEGDRLVGIVTQTDLTRAQAISSGDLVRRIAKAPNAATMGRSTAEIPSLLAQLVAMGNRHDVVTRLITDIADTVTRRLLTLAESELGAPPVPYLWLACGSQGRQEQTGVSDQDNCMILSDDVTDADRPYFAALAKFVSDGMATCGYFYCPGDMMATNPRWCQPLATWRSYFDGWIAKPDPEAQMLASVMFDLRPIGGDETLFSDLQGTTLAKAAKNSIFT
ncbi:MAG: DUF294 nucleotidyltransferase-like domain-containing protein, partial [Pseudomonadota bacterium]